MEWYSYNKRICFLQYRIILCRVGRMAAEVSEIQRISKIVKVNEERDIFKV